MPQQAHSQKNRVEKRISLFRNISMVSFCGINPHDESTNWKFDRKDPETFHKIVQSLPPGVNKLLMPKPTLANAIIVTPQELNPYFTVNGVEICGGIDADGCVLLKSAISRTAVAIATADCATIVAHSFHNEVVIVAHAGRESVLDREYLEHGIQGRENFGIVHSILSEMKHRGYDAHEVFFGIFGGVRKHFEHHPNNAKYGKYNRSLIKFCRDMKGGLLNERTGEVDMYCVIRHIANQLGVPIGNVCFDNIDTGSDKKSDGTPMWASNRNGAKGTRNLIVVHPYWD